MIEREQDFGDWGKWDEEEGKEEEERQGDPKVKTDTRGFWLLGSQRE